MSFPHGDPAIDSHVQIHVIGHPHFANETFIEIDHARHRTGRALNALDNSTTRSGIENFLQSRAEQTYSSRGDNDAGEQRRKSVSALPLFTANERDGNTNGGGHRSDGVGPMMPGISCHSSTFDGSTYTTDGARQSRLHHDSDDQNKKREWRGPVMRQKNFANACDHEGGGGDKNTEGNNDRSQGFRFTMAIRM